MATTADLQSSAAIPARLYGDGSPSTGEPAMLMLGEYRVEVSAGGRVLTAAYTQLRLRDVGNVQAGVELAWDGAEGTRAVHVMDAAALRALSNHPALTRTSQWMQLRAKAQRARVGRTLGWGLLGLFVLLPVLLLLIFMWQSDRIASALATRVSIEREVALGEQVFAGMRSSLDLQTEGAAYEAVQTLGKRLTAGSKFRYQFHLARNDAVNAFAIPGGVIVVHTGLIKATRRPEELAGVLAHEVQHIEQRHSLQAMVKDVGLRGLWALVTGDVGAGLLGQTALELTSLTFSRDAEAEADMRGFDSLVANGVDPSGMADFFVVLANESRPSPPALLSTHPASEEREAQLRRWLEELKGLTFEPLRMGPWPPQ